MVSEAMLGLVRSLRATNVLLRLSGLPRLTRDEVTAIVDGAGLGDEWRMLLIVYGHDNLGPEV